MLTLKKLYAFFEASSLDQRKIYPFFSMVEKRKIMHRQMMQTSELTAKRVLKTSIPYSADVEKMGLFREPLTHYRPTSAAALAYLALWQEIQQIKFKV